MNERKDIFQRKELPTVNMKMKTDISTSPVLYQRMIAEREIEANAEKIYNDSVETLSKLLAESNKLALLSAFGIYYMQVTALWTEYLEPFPLLPPHIELLHAHSLRFSHLESEELLFSDFTDLGLAAREQVAKFYNDTFIQSMSKLLLLLASSQKALMPSHMSVNPEEAILNEASTWGEGVRNWSHPEHMSEILIALFQPLDEVSNEKLSLQPSKLVRFVSKICMLISDRVSSFITLKHQVAYATSSESAWKAYLAYMGKLEDLRAVQQSAKMTVNDARKILTSLCSSFVPKLFYLSEEDIRSAYADDGAIIEFVSSISKKFGDLSLADPKQFLRTNPTWDFPFIQLNTGFFLPNPHGLTSFAFTLIEDAIQSDPIVSKAYLKRRGVFLEERVENCFRKAFPTAQIFRTLRWREGKVEYENDILIIIQNIGFIIECKSGRSRDSAFRGGMAGFETSLQKLLIEPALQSLRAKDRLEQTHERSDSFYIDGKTVNVDTRNIDTWIRLTVTFDQLCSISSQRALKKAGFVSEEIDLPPAMTLAELELVFDVLESQAQIFHYLKERVNFEHEAIYSGDELDLLGSHIMQGGLSHLLNNEVDCYNLCGASSIFNPYFVRHVLREEVEKPTRTVSYFWKRILGKIELVDQTFSLSACAMILDMSPDQLKDVERKIKSAAHKACNQKSDLTFNEKIGARNTLVVTFGNLPTLNQACHPDAEVISPPI